MANTKIPSELIADSSITAAKLADGTITTADIADSNVTTAKIADSNVTTAKIGDAQVTTAKITDANVTTGKIADDAVTTAKMASNSVTSDTIASGITLAGNTTFSGNILKNSGDLTLDVPGAITLDAGTGGTGIVFADDGTSFGSLKGLPAAPTRLIVDSAATAGYLSVAGTEYFAWNTTDIRPAQSNMNLGVNGASWNDLFITGSIKTTSGNLTLDVAGDIYLDADGGDVVLFDGGVEFGRFEKSSDNFRIKSSRSDGDLVFMGNDNGSAVTALTLDMSAAGAATFNGALGIGVDPTTLLHINGSGDAVRIESTNTGNGGAQVDLLHFTSSPADNDIHAMINMGGYTSGSSSAYGSSIRSVWSNVGAKEAQLQFFTRDDSDFAARMIIDKDGNVGIGTSSPAKLLNLQDNSDPTIMFTKQYSSTTGSIGSIVFGNGNWDSSMASIRAIQDGTNDGGKLEFKTQSNASGGEVTRFTIFRTGLSTFNGPASSINLGGGSTGSSALYVNSTSGHTGEMLQILKNGSTRMEMSNAGKLGIGISGGSISSKLHVRGTQSDTISTANSFAAFDGNGGDGVIIGARTSSPFEAYIQSGYTPNIGTSHHYPLVLNPNGGNVGIGALNPQGKLHIESGNAHNKLSVTSTASGGTGYDAVIDLLGSASNSEVALNMGINGDADREQIKTYQSIMSFRTGNKERMVIGSNGKVVIHGNAVDWNETTQGTATGSLHLDPDTNDDNKGNAITWGASDHNNGTVADAGIYVRSDGAYGTKMYISTTDSYASGSKTSIKVDQSGRVTTPRQPNFLARRNTSGGSYNPHTYSHSIPYNAEIYDEGNNFNISNGLFTAPVDGMYIFQGSIYTTTEATGNWVQAWLTINGARGNYTDVAGNGFDNSRIISTMHMVKLDSGDTVGYHPYSPNSATFGVYDNVHHTWFRGYLIG